MKHKLEYANGRQALSALAMESLCSALEQTGADMRGVVICQAGEVVGSHWWEPSSAEDKMWVYSISKSFTSTAIGLAVGENLLTTLQKVISFFPEETPDHPSDFLAAMTVADLLSMQTGHTEDSMEAMLSREDNDWISAFLEIPVEKEPGTHFVYNTGASFMLSAILQRVTGKTLFDYLTPRLFKPLGIENISWDTSPQGITTGGWGIRVRLEDLAKLGLLYLQQGEYQGKRILAKEWVSVATAAQADNSQTGASIDWRLGYGYQFWRSQHDGFRGDGACGQYCVAIPSVNAVVAINSETQNMQAIMDVIWAVALPMLQRHQQQTLLKGKEIYAVEENKVGVSKVAIEWTKTGLTFSVKDSQGWHSVVCGWHKWHRGTTTVPFTHTSFVSYFSQAGEPIALAARAGQTAEDTLELQWTYLENPHRERIICTKEGNALRLTIEPSLWKVMNRNESINLYGVIEK